MSPKTCLTCAGNLRRKPGEAQGSFEKRNYCSKMCRSAGRTKSRLATNRAKPPKTGLSFIEAVKYSIRSGRPFRLKDQLWNWIDEEGNFVYGLVSDADLRTVSGHPNFRPEEMLATAWTVKEERK